jgi:hypothetical protein
MIILFHAAIFNGVPIVPIVGGGAASTIQFSFLRVIAKGAHHGL